MTEKHIPFSGPMVRAILEGCKTQTRRVRRGDEPKYRVGDHLWVRENYAVGVEWDDEKPSEIDPLCGGADIWYMADGPKPAMYGKTRPSIFMPRWASRITLEVTGVRVGRVQDISEEDVLSEGTEQVAWESKDYREYTCMWRDCASAIRTRRRTEFRRIWDSINAKRGYGWDTNPWVFVYEFRRIQ
jgi:hypothetical protein